MPTDPSAFHPEVDENGAPPQLTGVHGLPACLRTALRRLAWSLGAFLLVMAVICGIDLFVTGFYLPWGLYLSEAAPDFVSTYGSAVGTAVTVHVLLLLGGVLLFASCIGPTRAGPLQAMAGLMVATGAIGAFVAFELSEHIRKLMNTGSGFYSLDSGIQVQEGFPVLASLLAVDLVFILAAFGGGYFYLNGLGHTDEASIWRGTAWAAMIAAVFLFSFTYHSLPFLILTLVALIFFLMRAVASLTGLSALVSSPPDADRDASPETAAHEPLLADF